MKKKRRVFDIDFEATQTPEAAPETKSFSEVQGHPLANQDPAPRRGPMATAISENAVALEERSAAEAAIRGENDALAHEHVRLKKLGLITDLIAVEDVKTSKLTRDRAPVTDPDLPELMASIQAVGLSNPIRVEQVEGGFELIQGFRRWSAFKALAAQTGDPRFARIPAAMVPRGESLAKLYQTMVDENLVRRDISFGEMAQLARSSAADLGMDVREAVDSLFASAGRQKRAYIKSFARLLDLIGGELKFPQSVPRALGLDLLKRLELDRETGPALISALQAMPDRDEAEEIGALRAALTTKGKPQARVSKPVAKTTLRLPRSGRPAKVLASEGRIEVQQDRDFSAVERSRLERALAAFLDALDAES